MEILKTYGEMRGKEYSETTLKQFNRTLRRINGGESPKNIDFCLDHESMINKINKLNNLRTNKPLSNASKKNIYISLVALLRATENIELDNKILDTIKVYDNQIQIFNKEYEESKYFLTEKEKKNWSTIDELKMKVLYPLKKIYEAYCYSKVVSNRDCEEMQHYIISACYLLQPALRCDWANVRVYAEEGNYLKINGNKVEALILNEYKTKKTYGTKEIKLDAELCELLSSWITTAHFLSMTNKDNYGKLYLLNGYDRKVKVWKPMNRNSICKIVPKVFEKYTQKNITIGMLRQFHITENISKEEIDKAEKMASDMCHSVTTQQKYYNRG